MQQIDEERVSGCQPAQQQRRCPPRSCFPPSPRQYAPQEFGLGDDEQFQHPRMFENLEYETDVGAFEQMRTQNARPCYQQQPRFNIADLPSEQLEDFSDPQFSGAYDGNDECNVCSQRQQQQQQQQTPNIGDISEPDFCDISDASPWPERTPPPQHMQSPMRQQQRQPSYPDECLDDESAPMYDSPTAGTPTPQFHYSPIEMMATPDVCAPSPATPTPTPPPRYSPIRFQPSPVRYPSECLEDVSSPSFAASPYDMPTPPSPARVRTPQNLPSDRVCDVSMPSFRSPPTPSMSFPDEMLDELTMPSFLDASCGSPLDRRFLLDPRLADESMPSFASSGVTPSPSPPRRSGSRRSSPCRSPVGSPPRICPPPQTSPYPGAQPYEPTPKRRRSSPPRRFNLAQIMSQRQRTPSCSPARSPSPCPQTPPAAPHFSLYSPTPVGGHRMPSELPSECLTDISEPAYFSSPPRGSPQMPSNLPSECLGDISAPSYQMTPPARTPSLPCDLPSEQLFDMSQPMYDSPRSERLSSMSMPSFADTSCGSPLDRRFVLDSRIMDESPPTFASSYGSPSRGSSPCPRSASPCPRSASPCPRSASPCPKSPSPCAKRASSPCPASRSATPQRSLPPPCFAPSPCRQRSRSPSPVCPPAPHFSYRSPTPVGSPARRPMPTDLPDECLMDISEPAYFSSPPRASPDRRPFPGSMTSECLADISAPSYEMTPPPRTPSLPQNLPSDMICDMSQPMYQSPASERLSGETMPSFADTSCGSPLDRRFLLDPYLGDESMPSMASTRSAASPGSPCPQGDQGEGTFDQTYCEILQRFNALKCKVNTPQSACSSPPGMGVGGGGGAAGGMQAGECIRETVVERTQNENGQLESTTQHIVVTIDPCGSLKTHTKEVKTQFPQQSSPQRLLPPSADSGVQSQSPRPAEHIENLRSSIRRRLSFNLSDMPNENLADVSAPCEDELPSMDTENMFQQFSSIPNEQLMNISAPSYRTPPTPSISYPSERLDSMSMPSFENASCGSPLDRRFLLDPRLVDESPPSFASSYGASPPQQQQSYRSPTPQRSPAWQSPSGWQRTPSPGSSRFGQDSMRQGGTPGAPTQRRFSLRSPSPRGAPVESPYPPTPPAPHFSLRSPTPVGSPPRRPFPTNLPSQQLTDISEPAYFSSPPRASGHRRSMPSNLPSERLDDISQPSYQRTPPPQTPGMPSNLPSEMLGNVSAPSYRSPASEHISSVSMPSFADVSYESPLDRRFLLDPRLADESMPSYPGTPSTSHLTDTPRGGGAARRRLSYSHPDSSRGNADRGGPFRSSSEGGGRGGRSGGQMGPATVEQTHTTIQQSGTYQQEHSVTPAERASRMSQDRHGGHGPLMDAAKEQLKMTTSIHSITRVYPEGPKGSSSGGQVTRRRSMSMPSENLGDVSMPSGMSSSTTRGASQRHGGTQNLNDISMPSEPPSMSGMSTTGGGSSGQHRRSPSNQNLDDISMPSGPSSSMYSTRGGSPQQQRTRRQRSVQNINDISPISFASTTGSNSRRGSSSDRYTSTSCRGFSGLANYAPFIEQIRSRSNSQAFDPCDPCSPCAQTIQNANSDPCDPCTGLQNSNRARKPGTC